jgi:hypothetical protein
MMRPRRTLLSIALLAGSLLFGCAKKDDAPAPPSPAPVTTTATNLPAPTAAPNPAFAKLNGKWRRPDGGYIIEIKSVAPDGKLDVGYFNPRPINIAKAEASPEGTTAKVFIELRDVNYAGSTYTLVYDPAADQLKGVYFHAGLHQQFEVIFTRTQ